MKLRLHKFFLLSGATACCGRQNLARLQSPTQVVLLVCCLFLSPQFALATTSSLPIELSLDDPVEDNTGPIDVLNMTMLFDNGTGVYVIHLFASPSAPFIGSFRININLFNEDTGGFFQDAVNDYNLAAATTVLTLNGTDPGLTAWNIGDRVYTNSLFGTPNPPGISLFRSSLMSLPFSFLDNEDYIAFAEPALPALVQEATVATRDLAVVTATYTAFPIMHAGPNAIYWEVFPAALIQNRGSATIENISITFDLPGLPPRVVLKELRAGQAVWVTPPRDQAGRGIRLRSGPYTLKVVADPKDRVDEIDKTNNVYVLEFVLPVD